MKPPEIVIIELVIACIEVLPDHVLQELIAELERASDWRQDRSTSLQIRSPAWTSLRSEATRIAYPPTRIADLLRGAAAMDARGRARFACEVAWTGPTPPLSSLRRTEQALIEVLDSARSELWLVSFAAHRVASVQSALVAAAARGCRVRLLFESEAESAGKLSSGGTDSVQGELAQCCELYVWPREKRSVDDLGRFGTLHAKCALADGEQLFVGSANLTEFAFQLNIELGVRVRNPSAASVVQRQLAWLVETGTVERLS